MKFAMDHGSGETVLAVASDDAVIIRERHRFSSRDNGKLIPWIVSILNEAKIDPAKITEWVCGTGPGSFTGLRIAAASLSGLVAGLDNGMMVKGVPSALGVISQLDGSFVSGDTAAVIYDGRNRELLYYGVAFDGGHWRPNGDNGVIKADEIGALFEKFPKLVSLEQHRTVIADERVVFFDTVDAAALIANPCRSAVTELVYLRPAVFTAPKAIREV